MISQKMLAVLDRSLPRLANCFGLFFNTDNDDFVEGQFRVQCGQNGKYLVPIEWPTCIVENCTSLLTQEGYYSETVVPVAVDDVAIYKCDGYPDKVFDDSAELPIKCGPDGQFITPSWPACR